jgi:[ribosomal protein S5]-alanine N-acetyltransferase
VGGPPGRPGARARVILFETERLRLGLPGVGDAAEIARFYVSNRDHLQPWSPTLHPGLFSERFWRDEVGRRRAEFDGGREARGFLSTRDEPARVIGNLSLTQISRGAFHACTLGYALAADAQGRGYMLEAVRGAVAYAFGPLGLHRVMANYVPRNRRSAAVLRRAGFVVEGYARDYLMINGRWEDHVMTAIANSAWQP